MKHISILGSTGSIGTQTLEVIRSFPGQFCVDALSAHSSLDKLWQQILEFRPKLVAVGEESTAQQLTRTIVDSYPGSLGEIEVMVGSEGLRQVATYETTDTLITSVVGMVGLLPTLEAIKAGKRIGLANKETMVTAGHLVMEALERYDGEIIPVDSEHSAIFQCLAGESKETVSKILITASGGPFRGLSKKEIRDKTWQEALRHPNWSMGAKITIDSATLMNKGLEVIEAKWLFGLQAKDIQVLVHPQSIIHSMVAYRDGSIKAQLGVPSMKLPILYAMTYPDRLSFSEENLDLLKYNNLTFEKPNMEVFPCLKLAYQALQDEGSYLTVLNAVNEIAVQQFLKGTIGFYQISDLIESALKEHNNITRPTLEEVLEVDRWARKYALAVINRK